jgi:hypothetical protein
VINLLNRFFTGFFVFFLGAVTLVALFGAAYAARKAYRWIRFHCGRVKDDGPPLEPREIRALVTIRRRYRDWAPEPVYRQREDS